MSSVALVIGRAVRGARGGDQADEGDLDASATVRGAALTTTAEAEATARRCENPRNIISGTKRVS